MFVRAVRCDMPLVIALKACFRGHELVAVQMFIFKFIVLLGPHGSTVRRGSDLSAAMIFLKSMSYWYTAGNLKRFANTVIRRR